MTRTGSLKAVDQSNSRMGSNDSRLELLLFSLNQGSLYGINVFKVREVLSCPRLNHLPKSHPSVKGVAHVRGETITILDLDVAIGNPPIQDLEDRFVIIAELCNQVIGFLVDSVSRIVNLNWDQIHEPPLGSGDDNYIVAVTELDSQLVSILDVEKIMVEIMPKLLQQKGDEVDQSPGLVEGASDKSILIVDDSLIARKHIEQCIGQMGFKTKLFSNGLELYNHLQEIKAQGLKVPEVYDLLICDIEMPEMDGYTLLDHIRADENFKNLVVLLHTSLSGQSNVSMAKSSDADDFMSKFSAKELSAKVLRLLALESSTGEHA